MKCANCGATLIPGARFCGKCRAAIKLPSEPSDSYGGERRFTSGSNRMPQGIALGVDERIVKQYKIGRYTFRQGSIYVIVTNKRVIRYEESTWLGMQNNQIDEINIDAVHGVFTHMRRSISILGIVIGLVLLIIGLSMLFAGSGRGYDYGYGYGLEIMSSGFFSRKLFGFIALVVSGVVFYYSLKPTLEFGLMGAIGNAALSTVVNKRGRIIRNDSNSVIFQFKPTAETTTMLKEIGACIYDLKTLGDSVIEKWSK